MANPTLYCQFLNRRTRSLEHAVCSQNSFAPQGFFKDSILKVLSATIGPTKRYFLLLGLHRMATLEITHIDLECGRRSSGGDGGANSEEEEEEEEEEEVVSVCFSDGSSDSQFYSTIDGDGSYDDYSFACGSEILEADPCEPVDLECGEKKENLENLDRDCRICHLSLISCSPDSGVPIELGCSCKDDLAAAHRHCAETWFKIKGNKTCEICNSIARNVVGPSEAEAAAQQAGEGFPATANGPVGSTTQAAEARRWLNGHRFLNFLLASMVFAFIISWLFHFNIPS